MLFNLTRRPTLMETELFAQTLTESDTLLLSDAASVMAFQANPFAAAGLIRQHELDRLGGQAHESWQVIDDHDWVKLVTETAKTVVW